MQVSALTWLFVFTHIREAKLHVTQIKIVVIHFCLHEGGNATLRRASYPIFAPSVNRAL